MISGVVGGVLGIFSALKCVFGSGSGPQPALRAFGQVYCVLLAVLAVLPPRMGIALLGVRWADLLPWMRSGPARLCQSSILGRSWCSSR